MPTALSMNGHSTQRSGFHSLPSSHNSPNKINTLQLQNSITVKRKHILLDNSLKQLSDTVSEFNV